jgi:hypothetical protein
MEWQMLLLHIGYLSVMGVVGMMLTYPKFTERLSR